MVASLRWGMNALTGQVRHSLYSVTFVRACSRIGNSDGLTGSTPAIAIAIDKPPVKIPAISGTNAVNATRAPVILKETDLAEEFIRGSGPGGQSINKSMNRVRLTHIPTGMTVTCQEQRDLTSNRKIARTTLQNKLNFHINGDDSKIGRRIIRLQRRKQKAHSRAKAKYKKDDNTENN